MGRFALLARSGIKLTSMKPALLGVLITSLLMSDLDSSPFDARTVPCRERIKLANSILGKGRSSDALKAYEKSVAHYQSMFSVQGDGIDGELVTHLGRNDDCLGVAWDLDAKQSSLLSQWLKSNEATLDAIETATSSDKVCFPFDEGASRLSDAMSPIATQLVSLAKLVLAKANEQAIHGDWNSAVEWNRRARVMGLQMQGQPLMIYQQIGFSVESRALRQMLNFASRCPSLFLHDVIKELTDQIPAQPSDLDVGRIESVFTYDMIESVFDWLNGGNESGRTGEMLATMVGTSLGTAPGIADRNRFKDVDELRSALKKSSIEIAWKNFQQQCRLFDEWRSKPFHERWKTRAAFSGAYWRIVESEPCSSVLNAWFEPTNYDYCEAAADAQLHATISVFGTNEFMRRFGKLPDKLEDVEQVIKREFLVDPFSGDLLKYKVDVKNNDFTLYSVGDDQVDDGGLDVGFRRGVKGDFVYWPLKKVEFPPMEKPVADDLDE